MEVIKLEEHGYESAALGFSLSFNTSVERAKQLLPKYAWGKVPGENKFLRTMQVWLDVDFPRLLWPEVDQYKVGTTTLSESTVHTLAKRLATPSDFEPELDERMIDIFNEKVLLFREKKIDLYTLKQHLPESFLQRKIWNLNYANLQNIFWQRRNHRVVLWDRILDQLLPQMDHPEFIVQGYTK